MTVTAPNTFELMTAARDAGNSVVQTSDRTKKPTGPWKHLQDKIADDATMKAWRNSKSYAIIQGKISRNGELLDFEKERAYSAWKLAVGPLADGLPVMRTGGGGIHVRYRRTNPPLGNTKLAWEPNEAEETGREILIETRGEGGYGIGPGSIHPTGNRYELLEGDWFSPPVLSEAHADALLNAARKLCEAPFTRQEIENAAAAKSKSATHRAGLNGQASVIDEFNRTHDLRDVLAAHGYGHASNGRMIRPNADPTSEPGVIFNRNDNGVETCFAFSTNDPLNDGHKHDAFSVLCKLQYGGDCKKTVKAVADEMGVRHKPGIKTSKEVLKSGAPAEQVQSDGYVPLGERDPATGKLVLSAKRTRPTAKAFIEEFYTHPDGITLHDYAGILLTWSCNRNTSIELGAMLNRIQGWLANALQYQPTRDGGTELVPFNAKNTTESAALDAIRAYVYLSSTIKPPAWLDGRADPKPTNLLPTLSGNLDVTTGTMYPPTPLFFNVTATDFEYEANPEPPERFIRFIEQLFGDDIEQVEALQEWFGYLLVGDTSQQKMLLLIGPRRSGKGTIARVLTRLVGAGNVAGPTTSSLAGMFGLQPLIGKSLAIVSDARFTGENIGVVVERLLCISGGDRLTIDRKFQTSIEAELAVRFVFLTNELPKLADASGALAGRFIVLRLTKTFYGQEDITLTNALCEELPGILQWSIEGLKRLRRRGHFVQPTSVADAIREMEDLSSPIGAFVREWCNVKTGCRIQTTELFEAWKVWCKEQGRDHPGTLQTFGRDLRAAVAGLSTRQQRTDSGIVRVFEGIDLHQSAKNAVLAAKMHDSSRNGGNYAV